MDISTYFYSLFQILVNLLNGLNRSVPHIEVMSIIFDIFISLAEFHETRPLLAKMEIVYEGVLGAMAKGEKNSELFGKGCSLFWRLSLNGLSYLKQEQIFKKLIEFEETQKRKKKQPSSSGLTKNKPKMKSLTTKHGYQLTENIVRFHFDPYIAINVLMKRLRKTC